MTGSSTALRFVFAFAALLLPGQAATAVGPSGPAAYPPLKFSDTSGWGKNVQRTMRLLATSTPQKRNTVRVLFYGQSITEQQWSRLVADDLRRRFPHANLLIENRALGGFASQLLVTTADTDLYPFYPDLLIFHVYGAHDKYEDILRHVRERTTAEILQQNDHVNRPEDLSEETDPAKLPPRGTHWSAFMNHNWLPSLARKYGTELCDQRGVWKQYLKDNHYEPKALLRDGVHLNAHGDFVMAECVKAYLRYDPRLGPSPAEAWVKTFAVGKDVRWQGGKLRLDFEGNRVDAVVKPGRAAPAAVRIDTHKPSEFPELYGFTRALPRPGGKWPALTGLSFAKLPSLEEWTMQVRQDPADTKRFTFTVTGSRTGPDGAGQSDQRFVSNSGRLVVDPEDWNVAYALGLAGVRPVPPQFTVTWKVVPYFRDEFVSPGAPDRTVETTVTLAQGLANGRHTLEITGAEDTPLAALRVYRPPLGRKK